MCRICIRHNRDFLDCLYEMVIQKSFGPITAQCCDRLRRSVIIINSHLEFPDGYLLTTVSFSEVDNQFCSTLCRSCRMIAETRIFS
jgi:hypothetical protein